jgi:hypothetical protein
VGVHGAPDDGLLIGRGSARPEGSRRLAGAGAVSYPCPMRSAPRLAALFWFHRDPAVCADRLQLLRRVNPGLPIYGLYGGPLDQLERFRPLERQLDDFYAFPEARSPSWKWKHGDLVIAQWHRERGAHLAWDTLAIAQWDMLFFAPLEQLFAMVGPDQLLLSGLRPVSEVESIWSWTRGGVEREEYLAFVRSIERAAHTQPPLCCQFVVACLPRSLLDRYGEIPEPEAGFVEYRLPTWARHFGYSFQTRHPYDIWWPELPAPPVWRRTLTTSPIAIRSSVVTWNLLSPGGARIFHPFTRSYPAGWAGRLRQMAGEVASEGGRVARWLTPGGARGG